MSNKYLDPQNHVCPTYHFSSHFSIFNRSSKDLLLYLTSFSDYPQISVSGTFLSVLGSQGKRITVTFGLISVECSLCRSNVFKKHKFLHKTVAEVNPGFNLTGRDLWFTTRVWISTTELFVIMKLFTAT